MKSHLLSSLLETNRQDHGSAVSQPDINLCLVGKFQTNINQNNLSLTRSYEWDSQLNRCNVKNVAVRIV